VDATIHADTALMELAESTKSSRMIQGYAWRGSGGDRGGIHEGMSGLPRDPNVVRKPARQDESHSACDAEMLIASV